MTDSKLHLKPLGDCLVIEPQESERKTPGGMFLTAKTREKTNRGTILAVGLGRIGEGGKRVEMGVKTGDIVLFVGYNGTKIRFDNRKLLILKESDILAIFEM